MLLQTDNDSESMIQDCLLTSELVDQLQGGRVLIVGDVMLDHYLFGSVSRISPEAPVPVVQVQSESYLLGGAGNVARNITSLGGEPFLLSYRGSDPAGDQLESLIKEESIPGMLLKLKNRPTTTKTRVIAHQQQVCRVDKEQTNFLDLDDIKKICDQLKTLMPQYNVLILSDYGKGLVQNDFMTTLFDMRSRLNPQMKILVDPKTRNAHLYNGATLMTPNTQEAAECGQCISMQDMPDFLKCGSAIFRRLATESLLITLGARGMVLFSSPEHALHIPAATKKVFDVTGAGDTVIAVLGLALSQQIPLLQSSLLANTAAGIVVGLIGAARVKPEELKTVIYEQGAISVEILK